jgi:hypothetical protein
LKCNKAKSGQDPGLNWLGEAQHSGEFDTMERSWLHNLELIAHAGKVNGTTGQAKWWRKKVEELLQTAPRLAP